MSVFRMEKQTFQKDFQANNWGATIPWQLNIHVQDRMSEAHEFTHTWTLNVSFPLNKDSNQCLTIGGSENLLQFKYVKCICKVNIISSVEEIVFSYSGFMDGPAYNQFHFNDICDVTTLSGRYGNLYSKSGRLSLSLTISSCEEKIKSLSSQKIMLDEGILTDLVIKTKEKEFHCHKFPLAAQSEYFRVMFQSNMRECNENVVDWVNVFNARTVQDLLYFIYTRETPPNIDDTYSSLVEAAHLCLLEDLKKICEERMLDTLNVANAAEILQVAENFALEELKERTVNFVANHCEEVLESAEFQAIEPGMKARLLASVFRVIGKISIKRDT